MNWIEQVNQMIPGGLKLYGGHRESSHKSSENWRFGTSKHGN